MQGGLHRPARHGRSPDYYLSNSFNKSETNDTHTSLFSPSLQVPLWEPPRQTNNNFPQSSFPVFLSLSLSLSLSLFFFSLYFPFLSWGLFLMGMSNYREKHSVDGYSLVDAGGARFVCFFFNQYTEMVIVFLWRRLSFCYTIDTALRYRREILMNRLIATNLPARFRLIKDSLDSLPVLKISWRSLNWSINRTHESVSSSSGPIRDSSPSFASITATTPFSAVPNDDNLDSRDILCFLQSISLSIFD